MAAARRDGRTATLRRVFPGDRGEVRAATVAEALELARALAG
jgi:nicotinamide mononucleotide (NMN) deamidase PncC